MNKVFLFVIFISILVFPSLTYADGPYLNIPPTNAFDKIHSDNGTISAVNFSMPLNIKGTSGITVNSNNSTHTLTISSSTATATGTYNETQANNVVINSNGNKINFINGSGTNILVQDSKAGSQVNVTISSTGSGTNQGTYNQTLANNSIINSGGSKINFVNGTGNPIHIVNSNSGQKVNVTINSIGAVFTTRTIDLSSSSYSTVIDNNTGTISITATSDPTSPQFVQTISGGNIPTDTTDVQDYTVVMTVGGKNTNATTAKTLSLIGTRNGVEVTSTSTVTVTNGNFWETATYFSSQALVAGDKLGLKLWCSSSPCSSGGGLDFRYATIYIVPRQITCNSICEIINGANSLTLSGAIAGVTYGGTPSGQGNTVGLITDSILGGPVAASNIGTAIKGNTLSEFSNAARINTDVNAAPAQQAGSDLMSLTFQKFIRFNTLS